MLARRATVLASLLLTSCCFGLPSSSSCASECARAGACRVRTERTGDALYRCYAGSDADCAGSDLCREDGRCFAAEDGECVRESELAARRCAVSVECRAWGGCRPREGFCEPQTNDDCARSLECLTQGRCSLDASVHGCFARDASECARSTGCTLEGLCSLEQLPLSGESQCVLGASGSCAGTLACTRDGRCAPRPVEGCSEGCRLFYCGRADAASAPAPCTEMHGAALLVCEPDGRCMRDASGACAHLP